MAEYCPLNDINDRIHTIFGAFINYKSISNALVFADLIVVHLMIIRYIASGLLVKAFSYKEDSDHFDVCKYSDHTTSFYLCVGIKNTYIATIILKSN